MSNIKEIINNVNSDLENTVKKMITIFNTWTM